MSKNDETQHQTFAELFGETKQPGTEADERDPLELHRSHGSAGRQPSADEGPLPHASAKPVNGSAPPCPHCEDPFAEPRKGHRSPPGTYERILKAVLETPSGQTAGCSAERCRLTDAEFRLVCYAATKPRDWVFNPKQIADALEWPRGRASRALRALRRKGYMVTVPVRGPQGQFKRRVTRLNRSRVVFEPDESAAAGGRQARDAA